MNKKASTSEKVDVEEDKTLAYWSSPEAFATTVPSPGSDIAMILAFSAELEEVVIWCYAGDGVDREMMNNMGLKFSVSLQLTEWERWLYNPNGARGSGICI